MKVLCCNDEQSAISVPVRRKKWAGPQLAFTRQVESIRRTDSLLLITELNQGIDEMILQTMLMLLLIGGTALAAEEIPARVDAPLNVACQGNYPHHLQGICTDEQAIYWSFTTTLVKTDMQGNVLKKIAVANHHGDLCLHDGKLSVAVNLGKFNDPRGNADSWVYVYDAESLEELARHETQEVFHGAGGIGYRDGHYFVVGGLPDAVAENYVYEYDSDFKFLKKHVIKSGHTHLGIQTATFAHDRWWFGCYGTPKILLVTDANFERVNRHELDCSLGIEGLSGGRLLIASGRCDRAGGCTGKVQAAVPDKTAGYRLQEAQS